MLCTSKGCNTFAIFTPLMMAYDVSKRTSEPIYNEKYSSQFQLDIITSTQWLESIKQNMYTQYVSNIHSKDIVYIYIYKYIIYISTMRHKINVFDKINGKETHLPNYLCIAWCESSPGASALREMQIDSFRIWIRFPFSLTITNISIYWAYHYMEFT